MSLCYPPLASVASVFAGGDEAKSAGDCDRRGEEGGGVAKMAGFVAIA